MWPTSSRFGRNFSFSRGVDLKVLDTPIGTLSMKGGLVFLKNGVVPFCNFHLVVASQNTLFLALGKLKMVFLCVGRENFYSQHCSSFQDTHVCTIRTHYHTLCLDSSQNIGRLTWKSWNLKHGSSFVRKLFQNIHDNSSLLFFLDTMSLKWTNVKAFHFFDFFWIGYVDFKTWSKSKERIFSSRCQVLQNY